jgi:hypothetical protein
MWLLEMNMERVPRQEARESNKRFRRYKKTGFDRQRKPRLTFDFNDTMTVRERQEEESRRKLFEHRWREEQQNKARQKRRNKGAAARQETWRDVLAKDRRKRGDR